MAKTSTRGRRIAVGLVAALVASSALVLSNPPAIASTPACGPLVGGVHHISTAAHLQAVGTGTDDCRAGDSYLVVNPIALSGDWVPVKPFTGTLDGGFHEISGLRTLGRSRWSGLFERIDFGGTVRNLILVDVEVSVTTELAGAIAGSNDGTIVNSFASGTVNGGSQLGGLVGGNGGGKVSSSYSAVSVTGGLGSTRVGGLVGLNQGIISDSYAVGSVTGGSEIGGLVGGLDLFGSIDYSYALGAVSGASSVGGLVGSNGDINRNNVYSSYFDQETSTQSISSGGTARSSSQMKTLSNYMTGDSPPPGTDWSIVQTAGFSAPDFTNSPKGPTPAPGDGLLWGISDSVNCGYPFVWWQKAGFEPCPLVSSGESASGPAVVVKDSLAATGLDPMRLGGFSVGSIVVISLGAVFLLARRKLSS